MMCFTGKNNRFSFNTNFIKNRWFIYFFPQIKHFFLSNIFWKKTWGAEKPLNQWGLQPALSLTQKTTWVIIPLHTKRTHIIMVAYKKNLKIKDMPFFAVGRCEYTKLLFLFCPSSLTYSKKWITPPTNHIIVTTQTNNFPFYSYRLKKIIGNHTLDKLVHCFPRGLLSNTALHKKSQVIKCFLLVAFFLKIKITIYLGDPPDWSCKNKKTGGINKKRLEGFIPKSFTHQSV